MDLLLLAIRQRHDVVVQRDGGHRLQVQARAAGRGGVHDAGNRLAMLRAHDDDVAAVAVGDDLVLQVLRRLASAGQDLRASTAVWRAGGAARRGCRPSAGLAVSATSPDGRIARRTASVSAMNERAGSHQGGEQRGARRAHPVDDRADGPDEARQAEQLQRRERLLGDLEMVQDVRQVVGTVDRQAARGRHERGGFERQVEAAADLVPVGGRGRAPGRAPGRATWTPRAPVPRGCGRTRGPEGQRVAWGCPRGRGQTNIMARAFDSVANASLQWWAMPCYGSASDDLTRNLRPRRVLLRPEHPRHLRVASVLPCLRVHEEQGPRAGAAAADGGVAGRHDPAADLQRNVRRRSADRRGVRDRLPAGQARDPGARRLDRRDVRDRARWRSRGRRRAGSTSTTCTARIGPATRPARWTRA